MTNDHNTMTLDECRDWLAENSPAKYGVANYRRAWNGCWERVNTRTGSVEYQYHPEWGLGNFVPATLDAAAAALPEGWGWTQGFRSTVGREWIAQDANGRNHQIVGWTGDEKLDRFRLAVACHMAEKGNK